MTLPKGWKQVTLADIASKERNAIVDGPFGSNLKLSDYVADGVPVLQGKNITGNEFQWFDVRFISHEKANELKRSLVREGDILIVKIGSIGYSARINDLKGYTHALIPANLCKVTPNPEIVDVPYLLHFLKSPQSVQFLVSNASATSQPALSLEKIKQLPVLLPPLPEQQRIAAILDRADRLRRTRRYAAQLSESFLQAVFVRMFGGLISNPLGFPIELLGDICDVRDGTHESPSYVQVGYPLVTSKNLANGFVDLSEVNLISEEDYNKANKRSKVDKGDIIMPMIGTIGNPVLIEYEPQYAIKNVALIKFVEGSPNAKYIRQLLSGYYFEFLISRLNRGGTQKFIALDDIRNFAIPLPPLALQEKFARIVQQFERLRAQQREAERQAEHLFQTLLKRAFSGEG